MKTEWFLAELVMKITVADDPRNVVHQNLFLIHANSADEAYEKAVQFGKNEEISYDNPAGKAVHFHFEGVSDLVDILGELEDGEELDFHYTVDMPEKRIQSLVLPRERLRAFLPPRRAEGPDYTSGEIMAKVARMLEAEHKKKCATSKRRAASSKSGRTS
ncbi:MAG: DUF4288 domain-containing protein [Terracidiphilus sp.]